MGPETGPIIDYGPENHPALAEKFAKKAREDGMSPEAVALALVSIKEDFSVGPLLGDDQDPLAHVFLEALEDGITPKQIEQALGGERPE